jgi:hypothetical protein
MVELGKGGDRQMIGLHDMQVHAQYLDDEFEGRSLVISVSSPGADRELVRELYQIDRQKGLVNQFVGGHGFTGLLYVYHPDSAAELQCFCEAR